MRATHVFLAFTCVKCSAWEDRSISWFAPQTECISDHALMAFESADDGLVLLQKSAKTKQASTMHSEHRVAETSSFQSTRDKLQSYVLRKMRISGSSKHYVIAQIVILVLIGVVVVCFSCINVRTFACTPAKTPTVPNVSCLDFRADGGIRHNVLEWSDHVCLDTKTNVSDETESNYSEDTKEEPSADISKVDLVNQWYEAPEKEKHTKEPHIEADPIANSLGAWYADGRPMPDATTPDTKFIPITARDEGPLLVPPKSAKVDAVPKLMLSSNLMSNDRIVLFVHAAGLCAASWSPIVRRLKNVIAIAYDQRGHGDSDAPQEAADYKWQVIGEDFLRIVASIKAKYGRPPDACVTHSFAGDCVLLALAKNPNAVGRLILLDPVLTDVDGATIGAKRLADATRFCGQREVGGFDSAQEVGNHMEHLLEHQLARGALDAEAKDMFSTNASAPDRAGRWHLKCSREHEAAIYENRIPLADVLSQHSVDADVHIVFAQKRRTALSLGQQEATARDRKMAERILKICRSGSSLHEVNSVGHFMVLEAPDLVAAKIQELLSSV